MKKALSIIICLAIMVCLIVPVSALENTLTVTVSPETATLAVGNTTDFAVNIADVPADCTSVAVQLVLSNGLTFNKATWGTVTEEDPVMKNFNKSLLSGVLAVDFNESDRITDGKLITFKIGMADTASFTETITVNVQITAGGQKYNAVSDTANVFLIHDHVYTIEKVEAKYLKSEATCTEPAKYYKSCSICGEASTTETFSSGNALGHNYKSTIVTPTCTEQGYTEHVCSRCDDTYKDNYTDALNHDLIDEVDGKYLKTPANCQEGATYFKHCSRCDFISTETFISGSPVGHTPGAAVRENVIASTCTAEGSYDEVFYCTVCNTELSRVKKTILKIDHTADAAKQENVKPATCTAEGSYDEVVYCTECNAELSRQHKKIDMLTHDYKTSVVEPTCIAGGYSKHVCVNCGDNYIDNETKALGHNWSKKLSFDATSHWISCTRCDEQKDKANHNFIMENDHYKCSDCEKTIDINKDMYVSIVSKDRVRPGNTVTVYVKLNNASDLTSLGAENIVFDNSIFTIESAKWLNDEPDIVKWNVESNEGVTGYSEAVDLNDDVLELVIKVSDTALDGDYPINLSFKVANNSLPYYIPVVPGTIVVRNYILGDVNDDEVVTDQDAIYTLFHIYFPEKYPVNQPCDFNKDGEITDQDAIYLLFHFYFPEKYPIE